MKLCKDCKHYSTLMFPSCHRDRGEVIDPVDGELNGPEYCCYSERENQSFRKGWFGRKIDTGRCGPEARFFEPKQDA